MSSKVDRYLKKISEWIEADIKGKEVANKAQPKFSDEIYVDSSGNIPLYSPFLPKEEALKLADWIKEVYKD